MRIEYMKKLAISLTNEEIEALRIAEKILGIIEAEIVDNDLEVNELDEILGDAWYEHYNYCSEMPSDIIKEVITNANN